MAGVQTMARYGRPFPSLSLFGPCSGSLFSSLPAKKVFSLHDLNMLKAIISPLPESSLPPWDAMEMKLPSTKEFKGMWEREEVHGEEALLQPSLPPNTRCLFLCVLVLQQPCHGGFDEHEGKAAASTPLSLRVGFASEVVHVSQWVLLHVGILSVVYVGEVTHLMMFTARHRNKQRPRKCGHAQLALAGVGTVRGRFSALHKSGHARSAVPTHVCVVGGLAKICILRLHLHHGHKQGLIGGSW
ncbi:uncharacterized protein [Aegilops tauschii subsp. strangulata]|uniref:uncharacterized protein n=1 Tax=Aegilops tauschii subsp. strangulata TaxID=200361 RepID=UPI001ABBF4AF|nr:uncharacterized protein LOC109763389 [Aegilops tauschii subsp. strangulata]